jgi:SnoaL-like domain
MTSASHKIALDLYESSWSTTDPAKRLELFAQSLSPQCVYTDPNTQLTGYEQLAGYMAELQGNIPGVRFVTTEFKTHHDRSLTHWNMEDGNGNVLGIGASHFVHGIDGRLMQMTGYFDQPPA